MGGSTTNEEEAKKIASGVDKALDYIQLRIKAWTLSGKPPDPKVSEDGVTTTFGGLRWFPGLDFFKLEIQPTHFGKKKRGRFADSLEVFDGRFGAKMEDFVKPSLSRRDCQSVTARVFDPLGKVTPLLGKLKYDLRRITS